MGYSDITQQKCWKAGEKLPRFSKSLWIISQSQKKKKKTDLLAVPGVGCGQPLCAVLTYPSACLVHGLPTSWPRHFCWECSIGIISPAFQNPQNYTYQGIHTFLCTDTVLRRHHTCPSHPTHKSTHTHRPQCEHRHRPKKNKYFEKRGNF